MKYYTEEEVQEIVLKAIFSGWNMSAEGSNAEINYAAECICEVGNLAYDPDLCATFKTEANAILKELNVQEI